MNSSKTLFVHPRGAILTHPSTMTFARCMGIENGRILFNGNCPGDQCPRTPKTSENECFFELNKSGESRLESWDCPCSEWKNEVILNGQMVVPGMCDAHVHFITHCLTRSGLHFNSNMNSDELLRVLREGSDQWPEDKPVFGYGFGAETLRGFACMPPREVADCLYNAAGGRDVFLASRDLHSGLTTFVLRSSCSSTDQDEKNHVDNVSEKNGQRGPGIIEENLFDFFAEFTSEYMEWLISRTGNGQEPFLSQGITWIHNFEGINEHNVMASMRDSGKLKLRFASFLTLKEQCPVQEINETFTPLGNPADNGYFFAGFKTFADGSIGSRSAAMEQPFGNSEKDPCPDTPDLCSSDASDSIVSGKEKSRLLLSCTQMGELLKAASEIAPLAIHAIGDLANLELLKALLDHETIIETTNGTIRRNHRIEHAQILSEKCLKLMELLSGCWAAVQPLHMDLDYSFCRDHLGNQKMRYCYPFASMINCGCRLMNSTDAPVTLPHLGRTFQLMTTRNFRQWTWNKNESITPEEVMLSYTLWPAENCSVSDHLGFLGLGALADFAVLSKDFRHIDSESNDELRVLETWINGDLVWVADQS
ncbi:MAG: hypothetical protein CVV64_05340 [Candidatus Wallbacteria bacterium HGW-Wallbacteria-1]|jgi:hypothetical protein|uniref:Amidohydrolase 3 domain-containing protein n=1 Tax=Candidatus Wallbacteria bacterium HGW-Wallbacteria-1 TaxID=2013854 RepID=A0A2N1PS75_9BACT|nr:MAG: hypothetical protein CVV64_05340 [Candidatus Wallbacteria bacterium HGW-Wallbacteria-1]